MHISLLLDKLLFFSATVFRSAMSPNSKKSVERSLTRHACNTCQSRRAKVRDQPSNHETAILIQYCSATAFSLAADAAIEVLNATIQKDEERQKRAYVTRLSSFVKKFHRETNSLHCLHRLPIRNISLRGSEVVNRSKVYAALSRRVRRVQYRSLEEVTLLVQ